MMSTFENPVDDDEVRSGKLGSVRESARDTVRLQPRAMVAIRKLTRICGVVGVACNASFGCLAWWQLGGGYKRFRGCARGDDGDVRRDGVE